MADFSKRLRELRINKALRQKDLAEKIGVAQTTIANYEQGTRFPDEETLRRITDFFDVTLDYLLGRTLVRRYNNDCLYEKNLQSVHENQTLSELALNYRETLLQGSKLQASQLIFNAVNNGTNIKDIYLFVFEKTLKEAGYLWETSEINVGKEHYITHITKTIMSQLYQYFNPEKVNHSIISLAVNGESHDVGIRMVSDFMEMEGWQVYFLGNNVPTESVIKEIKEYNVEVLALSATMPYNINSMSNLINAVRHDKGCKRVKIVVGGYGFYLSRTSWKELNADAFAENAEEASQVIKNLVED